MTSLLNAIEEIAEQNPGGFTVDLTTLKKVTKGISVAYLETQNSFGDEGLKRVLEHAEKHEKTVGGWLNEEDGYFYYDSVKIYLDREEAIRAGRGEQTDRISTSAILNLSNCEPEGFGPPYFKNLKL